MGFEEILNSINSRAGNELAAINESASNEIKAIEEHARVEAEDYASSSRARAAAEAARIMTSEISKANIEAKHIVDSAVMDRLAKALYGITGYLKAYTKTSSYAGLLKAAAERARHELGDCIIYVQKQDLKELPGSEQAKENFIGGIKAVSSDGTKEIDYTLEGIFSSLKQKISYSIMKKLKVGR